MQETGCYVDGTWGNYALGRMIDVAKGFGFSLSAEGEKVLTRNYGNLTDDEYEIIREIGDDAEEYLNTYHAEDGYSWQWYEGEFGYWANEDA